VEGGGAQKRRTHGGQEHVEGEETRKPRTRGNQEHMEARDTSIVVPKIVTIDLAGGDNGGWLLIPVFLMLMSMGGRRIGCYLRFHKSTAIRQEQIIMFPRYLRRRLSERMAVV